MSIFGRLQDNMIPDKKRLKKIALIARGRILDVGFNENPNPFLSDPVGFDLSNGNRKKAANYQKIVLGDCQKISEYFPEKYFDTIVAGEIIEHLENPSCFLRESTKILKDDGILLISTPNPYNISTIIANALFIRRGVAAGHINLFPFRNMLELLSHCSLRCTKVLNATGGTKFLPNPYDRYFFMPVIKSFCWQLLYVIEKDKRS